MMVRIKHLLFTKFVLTRATGYMCHIKYFFFGLTMGEVISRSFHPGGGITTRNKLRFLFVEMILLE